MSSENSSLKLAVTLSAIASISGLLIVLAYLFTLPIIQDNREKAMQSSALEVIPAATNLQIICQINQQFLPQKRFVSGQICFYTGMDSQGQQVFIIPAQGQGFADKIQVLYGYHLGSNQIVGFKVLESKETPGLGDKIAFDPNFLSNFKALSTNKSIEVVKNGKKTQPWQIDGITGATISSKAIGRILQESIQTTVPKIQRYSSEQAHGK